MTDAMFLRRTVTSVCVTSALGVVKPLYAVALSPSMRDGSAMPELAGKWRKPMTSFVTVQFSTAVSVSVYIAVLYTSVSLFFVFSSLLSTVPYREYKFLFLSLTVMKKASGPKSSIVRSTMTYTPAMRASVFCMFHTMYRPVSSMPWHFALISSLRSLFLTKREYDHLTLIINSPGGDLNSAFAIIDCMKGSALPVHTIGLGLIASCGILTFMSGEKGHRILTPN